jgi:hypothetical protein
VSAPVSRRSTSTTWTWRSLRLSSSGTSNPFPCNIFSFHYTDSHPRDWQKLVFYYYADHYVNFKDLVNDLYRGVGTMWVRDHFTGERHSTSERCSPARRSCICIIPIEPFHYRP